MIRILRILSVLWLCHCVVTQDVSAAGLTMTVNTASQTFSFSGSDSGTPAEDFLTFDPVIKWQADLFSISGEGSETVEGADFEATLSVTSGHSTTARASHFEVFAMFFSGHILVSLSPVSSTDPQVVTGTGAMSLS